MGVAHIKKSQANRLYYSAILTLILTTLAALAIMSVFRRQLINELPDLASLPDRRYHFVLIADQLDSPFWLEAYAGARQAASELDAVVEMVGSEHFSADHSLEYLDIAAAARIDGVATCVVDTTKAAAAINSVVAQHIPVVTMEYDATNSDRQCFVGVNSYDLGQSFGEQLTSQLSSGTVAILVSANPGDSNISENQIVAGLRDYLQDWPQISLIPVEVDRDSVFSAENIIRSLLIEQTTPIQYILSLNVEDTLRCVESLVDFGRTSEIGIVCYQENSDVLDYVKSGIVQAVLASDPWQIGYDSIKALAEIKADNRTSDYVPSRLVTITRQNVDTYLPAVQQPAQEP